MAQPQASTFTKVVAAAILLGSVTVAWFVWRRNVGSHVLKSFTQAQVIGRPPTWDQTIIFGDGRSVQVFGHDGPGGSISFKYSDDSEPKQIVGSWDYVYPCEIRYNQDTQRIYIRQSGLSGGMFKEIVLYEYDLKARNMIHRVHVSAGSLSNQSK